MRASILVLVLASPACAEALSFRLVFDKGQRAEPFTGRAYVMLTRADAKSLMPGVNWFRPEPFFAVDVKGAKPGEPIVIDRSALGHPIKLADLAKATYTIQAVLDFRPGRASFSAAPGNLWGSVRMVLDTDRTGPVTIKLDRVVKEAPFAETARIKLVEVESRLLKAFGSRPSRLCAAVILPESYREKDDRRYPAFYEIPGFGGDHRSAPSYLRM
ncbi:MAG: hypothetical protein K2W96_18615, partial [Gemmataceae bacterium]|nr:hypothetical protein [Gemmataceae bacterium]